MNVKLEPFVPAIVRRHDREKPWVEWIPGTVLFADVSGFTPMSETLAALGAEGAEILTDILNRYFAEMTGILHAHGGQVMKFGGDAILCFLEGTHTLDAAMHASVRMQEAMKRFLRVRTPVKTFTLQMKIGVASGECLLAGLGDPAVRCDYAFAGEPVDLASEAEHHATAGDIILAPDFARIPEYAGAAATFSPLSDFESPPSIIRPYMIPEVYDMVAAGYQRYAGSLSAAVSVFLQFGGFSYEKHLLDLHRLNSFVKQVLEVTQEYGGRLNRLSMGDKGSTMLLLFGAPAPLEKKEQITCQWAIEIRNMVRESFPELDLRIGMTSGRVFSGIVGGGGRFDFTVMGDCVNLAARLMQGAEPGQVCVDGALREKSWDVFEFESEGERKIKGKAEPVEVFALKDRRKMIRSSQSSAIYGRSEEITAVTQHLESARSGSPCMIVLEGEPGVGKSSLASQVLTLASRDWKIASGKGDITRRGFAYNPWREPFAALVFQGKKPTLDALKGRLQEFGFSEYFEWHSEFFGLHDVTASPDSKRYDEESKRNLLHHQLSVMLLGAIQSPSLLFLDDVQWFKSSHLDLLTAILNHMEDQPLAVLATARPDWPRDPFVNRSTCHFLSVKVLVRDAIREMAEKLLEAPVRDNVVDFLEKQARGNPFFLRQLLDHLTRNQLVTLRLGEWTLSREGVLDRSLSGEEIVVTQVEHLSLSEKMHLRAAACIGPTLSPAVLQKTLGSNFRARALDSLRASGYLQDSIEGRLAFPHALFQEALYHSLPKRLRRQYHRRIGFALEERHATEIEKYLPTLAHHFYEGGVRKKAIDYCIAAGNEYHARKSFPEAAAYLTQAFKLLSFSKDERASLVALRLTDNLLRAGRPKESLRLAKSIRKRVAKDHDPVFFKAYAVEFDVLCHLGDYSFIEKAHHLLTNPRLRDAMDPGRILFYIAVANYRRGVFRTAAEIFSEIVKMQSDPNPTVIACSMYLASMARLKQDYPAAEMILRNVLSASSTSGYFYGILGVETELATVFMESGRHRLASELYQSVFQKAEDLGDFSLMGTILLNQGTLEVLLGNPAGAELRFREAIQIFTRLGDFIMLGKGFLELGAVFFDRQQYSVALNHYLKAVDLFEKSHTMSQGCLAYFNVAEVLFKLSRSQEALEWLKKGQASFDPENDPDLGKLYSELQQSILASNTPQSQGS